MPPYRPPLPPLAVPAELIARTDLTSTAKVVWIGLARFQTADGTAMPLLLDLQNLIGMNDRTLRRGLADLVDAGLLTPVRMTGRTGFRFNRVDSYPIEKKNFSEGSVRHDPVIPEQHQALEQTVSDSDQEPAWVRESVVDQPLEIVGGFEGSVRHDPIKEQQNHGVTPLFLTTIEDISTSPSSLKKGGAGGRKRRTPATLPDGWVPDPATLAHCAKLRPDVDQSAELEKFRFYFTKGKAAGTQRGSWLQTYAGWIGRASPASPGPAPVRPGSTGFGSGRSQGHESDGQARLRRMIEDGA